MYYIAERVINISELENKIQNLNILAQQLKALTENKNENSEHISELSNELAQRIIKITDEISNFEFCVERRKTFDGYENEEIEKLRDFSKAYKECEVLPISELVKLLEEGWGLYDIRATEENDVKILTLAR